MTEDEDSDERHKITPELRRLTRYSMSEQERDTRRATTNDERARRPRTQPGGVPIVSRHQPAEDGDLDTGPVAAVEAIELDESDLIQVGRLRRDSPDPYIALYKLAKQNRQLRKDLRGLANEHSSSNEQRANQLLDLLNRPPHEDVVGLKHDVASLKESIGEMKPALADLSPVRRGLKWLTGSFVAVAVAIGCWLYARGGKETAIDMRIQALEVSVGKLGDAVQRLLERRETHP